MKWIVILSYYNEYGNELHFHFKSDGWTLFIQPCVVMGSCLCMYIKPIQLIKYYPISSYLAK